MGKSQPWHDCNKRYSEKNKNIRLVYLAVYTGCGLSASLLYPGRGQILPSVTAHDRLGGPRHPLLKWKSVYSCSLAMH